MKDRRNDPKCSSTGNNNQVKFNRLNIVYKNTIVIDHVMQMFIHSATFRRAEIYYSYCIKIQRR
jgi:hypothetical protein